MEQSETKYMSAVVLRDWAANVKTYVPHPNEAAIDGIVRYLGIALHDEDSGIVACADQAERERVRESFLKGKLGLAVDDRELDHAIADVCRRMQDERDKPRVTFYYLLAEKYGKLPMFT
jgi:hypothetical protein